MLFEMLTGGIHPIGERTTLIWPRPAEGKSRKWLREDPWKQWLKRGARSVMDNGGLDQEILRIIEDCLKIDTAARPSNSDLEARLLQRLNDTHSPAFETLSLTLAQLDQIATESQESGWPYYEETAKA